MKMKPWLVERRKSGTGEMGGRKRLKKGHLVVVQYFDFLMFYCSMSYFYEPRA